MNPRIRTVGDKKTISFSTEINVDEYVDVDVTLNFEDIIDDLVLALTEDHIIEIMRRMKTPTAPFDIRADDLKRHLCDITELSYHVSTEDIFKQLINLM